MKLGDFGISKALGDNQNVARTMVGTPYYMSPEILKVLYTQICLSPGCEPHLLPLLLCQLMAMPACSHLAPTKPMWVLMTHLVQESSQLSFITLTTGLCIPVCKHCVGHHWHHSGLDQSGVGCCVAGMGYMQSAAALFRTNGTAV